MKAGKKVKKPVKKIGKAAGKVPKKPIEKAVAKVKKKAPVKVAIKMAKVKKPAPKENPQLLKLRKTLAEMEKTCEKGAQTLKAALAGEKEKAAALKKDLEAKKQALLREFEEYKTTAAQKIAGLEAQAAKPVAAAEPPEKPNLVTGRGTPLTLLGAEIKVGDPAPDFQVLDNGMQPATLDSFKGQIKIISSVPSLDTPVCNIETRRFNEEAARLPDKVTVLTISMDLPFAQARWCAAAGVEKVKTFSDYRDRSFGSAYGVLIKQNKLLARAIFIVDDQNYVRYVELGPELTHEPDYERVLNAARALL